MPAEVVAVERGVQILVADSATSLGAAAEGAVCVTGSHGGTTGVLFALAAGANAAVFNDAGVGKNDAGVRGLGIADEYNMAAVAVDHRSARIGDGRDTYANGSISRCNRSALSAGARPGMTVAEATVLLARWRPTGPVPRPVSPRERAPVVFRDTEPRIIGLDSASSIDATLVGAVVLTGSHGGVVNGLAVRASVAAAFFNDAGFGKDDAGASRLPLLDALGIPGGTVDCFSAEIGSGLETYADGRLSRVNACASSIGWSVGQAARSAAHALRGAA